MTSIGREAIINVLRERAPRAMHLGEICARLQVPRDKNDSVLAVIRDLTDHKLVQEMPGRRFRIAPTGPRRAGFARGPAAASMPRPAVDVVHGRLTVHPRGFGFVAAEDGGPDVFLPPDALGNAMTGDYVAVQARRTPRGREGKITEVVSRGVERLTGTVVKAGRTLRFEPDDPRMLIPLRIVGRPPKEATREMAVVAEIVRYPKHENDIAEIEIRDVLGPHGTTVVEVEKIKIREGLSEAFPEEVLAAAEALPDRVTPRERRQREDLRGFDLCTIDPEDARDHDDALWAERLDDGGFRILVAIADVSHYVVEGTALDREAFRRGCSVYLPDRVIPMLPSKLSTDLASLVDGKDRLCMAVEIRLGPNGAVRSSRFIEGVMRSGAKLTYPGVARALGLTENAERQPEAEARRKGLEVLFAAAKLLRKRRLRRGALDLDLPEAKVVLDPEAVEPVDIARSRRDPGLKQAYQLVEEMMLLANEVVASTLTRRHVPTVYRVHGAPDEEKLEVYAQVAGSLGYEIDPEDARDPKLLSRFLRKLEKSPNASILNLLLLRAMQQATYDVHNIGHFGLASRDYLHFTSPIRRYPDLLVHRMVKRVIAQEAIDAAHVRPLLRKAAAESSRLERRAMTVERDVVDLYRAVLMKERIGEEFEATISSVQEYGVYATLVEPFVDVFIPMQRLGDEYFQLDELGIRLTSRRSGRTFALGDRIRIVIEEVNLARQDVLARLAGREAPAAEVRTAREEPRSPRQKRRAKIEEIRKRADGRRKARREATERGETPRRHDRKQKRKGR